jgi:hypothetical protein
MAVKVKCLNEDNVSIEFSATETAEYFLEELDGVSSVSNAVSTSDNTMTDGATYQGSVTKARNILIKGFIDDDYINRRNFLYNVAFKPKSFGTFTYYEDDEVKNIPYVLESIEVETTGIVRHFTVSIICPDPFFLDLDDTVVTMSGWQSLFEWPHTFLNEKEEFGRRIKSVSKDIANNSAADYIGIKISITVDGTVVNPAVYHLEQAEFIKLGNTSDPLTMVSGDELVITTGDNKKDIYLIHNGVKTNVNKYLDQQSQFIQLVHGTNTLKYDADSGVDYINCSITYRFRYLGV